METKAYPPPPGVPGLGGELTANLRASLAIFSAGFAIEGAVEAYTVATPGSAHPGTSLLFLVPAVCTLAGLLFVFVGRHEWNQVHRDRVRQANAVFALSLLGGVVAAAVVGILVAEPDLGIPLGAEVVYGAAIGSLLFGTFVTYAFLVFHLVGSASRAALLASLVWSFAISAYVGVAFATHLGTTVSLVASRSLTLPSFLSPVDTLASYLFVSYFLLLAAYGEAHLVVARGPPRVAAGSPPAA